MAEDRAGAGRIDAGPFRGEQSALIEITEFFAGPLPHPAILESFERVHPGSAEFIMKMARDSMDAEIEREMAPIKAEQVAFVSTSIAVAWLPWFALVAAVVLALAGSTVAAAIAGSLTIASGGAQLVQATRSRSTSTAPRRAAKGPAKPDAPKP